MTDDQTIDTETVDATEAADSAIGDVDSSDVSGGETAEEAQVPEVTEGKTGVESEQTPEAAAPELVSAKPSVGWALFIAYAVAWAALSVATFVILRGPQADVPAFRQETYPAIVLAGLVMTLLGPLVSLLGWFIGWWKAGAGNRGGLLSSALLRGATLTLLGVAAWVGVLWLVDALRLGLV